MSLLSARRLLKLIEDEVLVGSSEEFVNAASIDVRLGSEFMLEYTDESTHKVWLKKREMPPTLKYRCKADYYIALKPGAFVLGHIQESLNLPDNISAQFILKSSMGRAGLEHSFSGWVDAGYSGTLTLELSNVLQRHELVLTPGMRIGQIIFWEHEPVPEKYSYRTKGSYNGDTTVTGAKPR